MSGLSNTANPLTAKAREIFTAHAAKVLPELAKAVLDKLSERLDQPASASVLQHRRDAWLAFQSAGKAWTNGTNKAWRLASDQTNHPTGTVFDIADSKLDLMDNEVMENKILASRLGLRIVDVVSCQLNELRLRVQSLDSLPDLQPGDIFRPEVLAKQMIQQWITAGLSRQTWLATQEVIQNRLADHLVEAYHLANAFLFQHGSDPAPHEETRMQTATTPMAKAKMRAQGVVGGLMRMLTKQAAGFDDRRGAQASPQSPQAFAVMAGGSSYQRTQLAEIGAQPAGGEPVERAATALRQRTRTLKKAASTSAEKATIELVALMFQSILAEDRIPSTVRVWFARLQMPVLRIAMSEPEFFSSPQHPARCLIDRMGSCVLGFDMDVSGHAMELEIKRIVQVIEQYPETGRRVFQLMSDEFEKFLSKFMSENGSAARRVSIAQQVEQKEAMAIQYTIEMRHMLSDMPVRDEIREFLFKTWAEVLAISAMRNGAQNAQTLIFKRCAADLVWAASLKPNRAHRANIIADLPKLLQFLRFGMTMLGMECKKQDENIKIISDSLADAFRSKAGAI